MSKSFRNNQDESKIDNVQFDAMKTLKSKVINSAIKVIDHFNLGNDIASHLKECLINNDIQFDSQFSLKTFKDINKKSSKTILSLKNINTPTIFSSLSKKTKVTNCVIDFENKIKLKNIKFSLNYVNQLGSFNETTIIEFIFNERFELIKYTNKLNEYQRDTKILISKQLEKEQKNILPLSEEIFLINMNFNKDNNMIKELLPEAFIPSAYNIKSEDFKSRVSLVEMLLC